MIDFHTHILPRLDDGAQDERTSLDLLQAEAAQGVTTLLFTPHYYAKIRNPEQFLDAREKAFEKIKTEIPEKLRIRLGAEVRFETETHLSAEQFQSLSIENTRYVLVELPFEEEWSESLFERLARLASESERVPVLAHIERYEEVHKNPKILNDFVRRGWLLQVTTGSFVDKRNASLAFAMLKKGFVHCLGTDAHNLDTRAPDYRLIKGKIKEAGCEKQFEKVQGIMRAMLKNERIKTNENKPVKKVFWIYR
ncbi:MAG: hypothetical protein IJ506_00795 [Clostridia bacterium]|nr:hypothetical protein [Clostridia bacterium]